MPYEKSLQDWLELKIDLDYKLHGIEKSMIHMLELYNLLKKEEQTVEILEVYYKQGFVNTDLLLVLLKHNRYEAKYAEYLRASIDAFKKLLK